MFCYPWLSPAIAPPAIFGDGFARLRRNYGIADYLAEFGGLDVVKSVHIQNGCLPEQAIAETRWLQAIADRHGFPHGIVAHVALQHESADEQLAEHCRSANMRGIRQILNAHPDPALGFIAERDLMANAAWRRGFAALARRGLSFDLQIYPHQMAEALELARAFPGTSIILGHAGMPLRRDRDELDRWRGAMTDLAAADNVAVKISGLALGQGGWSVETIRPIVLATIEIFGIDRCMFASNFPVDGLFSSYRALFDAFGAVTQELTAGERAALFSKNAERLYRI